MVLALVGCSKQNEPEPTVDPEPEPTPAVMSYAEYEAASIDDDVVVEAYVQAVQSYWNGAKLYLQDKDGAYFVYCDGKDDDVNNISEEDYAKLVDSTDYSEGWMGLANGTKVHVEGTKAEFAGEIEIRYATVTIVDDGDKWLSTPVDVTDALPTDPAQYMNQRVVLKDLTVVASNDDGAAFLYNWDGSGEPGNDLYYRVEKDGMEYSLVVESYLCYDGSEPYEAVEALQVGQVIDVEGFLYWYEGPQLHTTSVTVK